MYDMRRLETPDDQVEWGEQAKMVREGLGERLNVALERHRKELAGLAERLRYVTAQTSEADQAAERAHLGYSPMADAVVAIQDMTEYVISLGQRIEL